MEQRSLGKTAHSLSAIGLGCVTFGREIDENASYQILDHAMENGITWLDTAEGYGGGNARQYRQKHLGIDDVREVSEEMSSSECIIGRWLRSRGCRDRVTICTKVGTGASPENIRRALSASLERLQIETVDIYELHAYDPKVPIGETLGALNETVSDGLVRVIGCSNLSADQLRAALQASDRAELARFEIIQPPYNMAAPSAREDLFPLCREEQIAVTTYSPLAAGFLSGKYSSGESGVPKGSRFDVIPGHSTIYFSDQNFRMVDRLRAKAERLGIPMVRLAMAWAMAHPDVTSVIVGARKIDHIDNALAAYRMKLDADLLEEMTSWTTSSL